MNCRPITPKEAEAVMLDKEILERVVCDGADATKLPQNAMYIGGFEGIKLFGVFMYLHVGVWTCHMHILKEFRGKYGVRFGKKALEYSPDTVLFTNIPEAFKEVIKYAKYFGFKQIDKIKNILIFKR